MRADRIHGRLCLGESTVELTTGVHERVSTAELLEDGVLKVSRKHLQRDARGRPVGGGEYELTYYAPGSWVAISSVARVHGSEIQR